MQFVGNWVAAQEIGAASGETFEKLSPATGKVLYAVARSGSAEASEAVSAACAAQPAWAAMPGARRGDLLFKVAEALEARAGEMAAVVHAETGKSMKDALGETMAAVALGKFMAGEGRRFYGRTTTSAMDNRQAMTVLRPVGVAALIIAANTPVANVAWKVFPALACGNSAVLKASEDTPLTADLFARIAHDAGLPAGVLNILQGLGPQAGAALVQDSRIGVISFTGSTAVGRWIMEAAGSRLTRVFLELGGKNPFVVCDDADLELAVRWAALSAFSNAGQRCASASRIIVCEGVYDEFKRRFVEAACAQKVGCADSDDFGPVINAKQLGNMLAMVDRARADGAAVLCGGERLAGPGFDGGFFLGATVLEGAGTDHAISRQELFGPITCLYRARDFAHALALANDCDYGLTACVHTGSLHRAQEFVRGVQAGVAVVNAGTFGSEPHMPFGGLKDSGNGLREPGTEALAVYAETQTVYIHHDPAAV